MSRDVLEKILYDLSTSKQNLQAFTADADKFLSRYQIADPERTLVKTYDVYNLAELGVNTMLTWGFWLQSGRTNADYMISMKQETSSSRGLL